MGLSTSYSTSHSTSATVLPRESANVETSIKTSTMPEFPFFQYEGNQEVGTRSSCSFRKQSFASSECYRGTFAQNLERNATKIQADMTSFSFQRRKGLGSFPRSVIIPQLGRHLKDSRRINWPYARLARLFAFARPAALYNRRLNSEGSTDSSISGLCLSPTPPTFHDASDYEEEAHSATYLPPDVAKEDPFYNEAARHTHSTMIASDPQGSQMKRLSLLPSQKQQEPPGINEGKGMISLMDGTCQTPHIANSSARSIHLHDARVACNGLRSSDSDVLHQPSSTASQHLSVIRSPPTLSSSSTNFLIDGDNADDSDSANSCSSRRRGTTTDVSQRIGPHGIQLCREAQHQVKGFQGTEERQLSSESSHQQLLYLRIPDNNSNYSNNVEYDESTHKRRNDRGLESLFGSASLGNSRSHQSDGSASISPATTISAGPSDSGIGAGYDTSEGSSQRPPRDACQNLKLGCFFESLHPPFDEGDDGEGGLPFLSTGATGSVLESSFRSRLALPVSDFQSVRCTTAATSSREVGHLLDMLDSYFGLNLDNSAMEDHSTEEHSVNVESVSSPRQALFPSTPLPSRNESSFGSSFGPGVQETFNSSEPVSPFASAVVEPVGSIGKEKKTHLITLPTVLFDSRRKCTLAPECAKCSICLDDFEHRDKQSFLPCFHSFHKHCIAKWLRRSSSCPICLLDIRKVLHLVRLRQENNASAKISRSNSRRAVYSPTRATLSPTRLLISDASSLFAGSEPRLSPRSEVRRSFNMRNSPFDVECSPIVRSCLNSAQSADAGTTDSNSRFLESQQDQQRNIVMPTDYDDRYLDPPPAEMVVHNESSCHQVVSWNIVRNPRVPQGPNELYGSSQQHQLRQTATMYLLHNGNAGAARKHLTPPHSRRSVQIPTTPTSSAPRPDQLGGESPRQRLPSPVSSSCGRNIKEDSAHLQGIANQQQTKQLPDSALGRARNLNSLGGGSSSKPTVVSAAWSACPDSSENMGAGNRTSSQTRNIARSSAVPTRSRQERSTIFVKPVPTNIPSSTFFVENSVDVARPSTLGSVVSARVVAIDNDVIRGIRHGANPMGRSFTPMQITRKAHMRSVRIGNSRRMQTLSTTTGSERCRLNDNAPEYTSRSSAQNAGLGAMFLGGRKAVSSSMSSKTYSNSCIAHQDAHAGCYDHLGDSEHHAYYGTGSEQLHQPLRRSNSFAVAKVMSTEKIAVGSSDPSAFTVVKKQKDSILSSTIDINRSTKLGPSRIDLNNNRLSVAPGVSSGLVIIEQYKAHTDSKQQRF